MASQSGLLAATGRPGRVDEGTCPAERTQAGLHAIHGIRDHPISHERPWRGRASSSNPADGFEVSCDLTDRAKMRREISTQATTANQQPRQRPIAIRCVLFTDGVQLVGEDDEGRHRVELVAHVFGLKIRDITLTRPTRRRTRISSFGGRSASEVGDAARARATSAASSASSRGNE